MIGMSVKWILVSVIAIILVSGCTGIETGNGVKVLDFGPDLSRVYPGEEVNFNLRFQNQGSVAAENVFAELLGLDEDWYDDSVGTWQNNENLPNEIECRYTETGEHKSLIPPNPQYGTSGEIQTCSWTYKAPGEDIVSRDMDRRYPVTARVFYNYRTDLVKLIPLLTTQEVINLQNRGGTISLGDVSSTDSPVKIALESESPIRVLGGGESVEFPVRVNINNGGDGTACILDKCKKSQGGEWNKIELKIITSSNVEFFECSEGFADWTELTLTRGDTNSFMCFVKIRGIDQVISQDTFMITARYSYFTDAESEVVVGR